jgi:predicted DNA binding protein
VQIVNLLIRHECPYSNPLVELSEARVTHLCHRGKEAILELHAAEPTGLARLRQAYEELGGETLYGESGGTAGLVRFPSCACCRTGRVIPTLEGLGYLYLPPSAYTAEGERYQFLAQVASFEPGLAERLPPGVTVVRAGVRPLDSLEFEEGFLVPVGALAGALTERQRAALTVAILRGYYRRPRAVRSDDLAREFGVSRAAFDALLRKAENTLATALFPYLALRGARPASPEPRAKGS